VGSNSHDNREVVPLVPKSCIASSMMVGISH